MSQKQQIGLIGLAVMGENLVLNMADHGYRVGVFNRTTEKVDQFVRAGAAGKSVAGFHSLKELVASLERPRRIVMMVKAGAAVDGLIDQLVPLLESGDILIDGGNAYFPDTIRRSRDAKDRGLHFLGIGVSGGEEGARFGPSIMPGGDADAYRIVAPIFLDIAAKVDGAPCCTYIGPDGAGHYVKMVHNGIEYGDMQLISEAYYLMKQALGMNASELHDTFTEWNSGDLDSFLIQITAEIFARSDPETGQPLVEMILDKAGQKGTGKWTSQSALDLGVATPTITEAVYARCMSAIKEERKAASQILQGPDGRYKGDKAEFVAAIHDALYSSKICSYAQGFAQMKAASKEYSWNLRPGEIALIWRGGCIIRARFLNRIKEAFDRNGDLANLLLDPYFREVVERTQKNWRHVVAQSAELGIPAPAFSSALAYFDSYRRERLPANLIQAQRDYFGAHTYERTDREGTFHTEWGKGRD